MPLGALSYGLRPEAAAPENHAATVNLYCMNYDFGPEYVGHFVKRSQCKQTLRVMVESVEEIY
jgi:hypothetical protein